MAISINGTSGISGVDGSAGTPALQGTDSNTGISFGTDTVNINTGGTTRATVDSSGRLGIGTTSPSNLLHLANSSNNQSFAIIPVTGTHRATGVCTNTGGNLLFGLEDSAGGNLATGTTAYSAVYSHSGARSLHFGTNNTVAVTVDSSQRVGIGTTSPDGRITSEVVSVGDVNLALRGPSSDNNWGGFLTLNSNNGTTVTASIRASTGGIAFNYGGSQRAAIDASGRLLVGTTSAVDLTSNVEGVALNSNSAGAYVLGCIGASASGQTPININRKTNDGRLIQFHQDGTEEGSIQVSGTTVSYNGAHLSRWSQLPSGAERIEILRGTVLSNIDEMCEWGDEENEQLNRMKVSDVEGDKNASGVFQSWDDDDDTYTNDFYCAMTGDFIIRIAAGVTVERGDLLMSAGDGTAKPQDDDIIRSKTIAKVTSTNVSCTYDDGSYCVPCVLMAC